MAGDLFLSPDVYARMRAERAREVTAPIRVRQRAPATKTFCFWLFSFLIGAGGGLAIGMVCLP